jgi:hypothetical protein
MRLTLQEWTTGNDPRVGALRQVEKQCSEQEREKEEEGNGGVHDPDFSEHENAIRDQQTNRTSIK